MREVPQIAIDQAQVLEGCVLRAYDDARPSKVLVPGDSVEGTLTAGYGHTGPDVVIGMTVTAALAAAWLLSDLQIAGERLAKKVGDDVIASLTENQYAALLLFVLNLGTGNPAKPEWTIWQRLRNRQYDQIPNEMIRFVNVKTSSGMVKSEGLVKRRTAEILLWSTDEPGSTPIDPPSSTTRSVPTPPTPTDPRPPSKSGVVIAGIAGGAASAGPLVNQATNAIQPYALQSHYVRTVLGLLAAIGAGLAILTIVLAWLKQRRTQH